MVARTSIQSYQDLRAWQEGMDLVEIFYTVTKTFPKEEIYGMTSQIRRAATSIPANIAEGYGKGSRGEYVQFLQIAQGLLKELETHLLIAKRVELAKPEDLEAPLKQSETVSKILRALISSLRTK